MEEVFNTFRPEGFSTVNSYFFVSNPDRLIQFLKSAFYGEEQSMTRDPETNEVQNCVVRIGESCIMVSQARGQFEGMRASSYLYVNDVDTIHQRALDSGGKEEFGPADMPYGDRQSGIQDPESNYWWISQRLVQSDYQD